MPNKTRRTPKPFPAFAASPALLAGLGLATLAALTACGGGGGGGSSVPAAAITPGSVTVVTTPTPTPTAVATATPTASATTVIASPNSLSFNSLSSPAQNVTITQLQNSAFTLSSTTCNGIASASSLSGAGPFAFSPLQAGSCTFTVTGAKGATATITIVVTTTSVTTQAAQRTK